MFYTSYAIKVVNCNVHCMKSGEVLAAPAVLLLMALNLKTLASMQYSIQNPVPKFYEVILKI